jgi:peptide chain release factor subunit 1
MTRLTLKCSACGYQEQHTVKNKALQEFEQSLAGKPCPKCGATSLNIVEREDVIDDFARLAEYTNTQVEVISTETEEGQMLKNSFGGVAAILRFKVHEQ